MNYRKLVLLVAICFMALRNQQVAADHKAYTGGREIDHDIPWSKLTHEQQQVITDLKSAGLLSAVSVCRNTHSEAIVACDGQFLTDAIYSRYSVRREP